GGRLRFHVRNWEEITEDSWVRQVVTHGYYPQFQFRPPLQAPPPFWITPRQSTQVQEQVDLLLKKGAVRRTEDPLTPGFYSPLFVVPKKKNRWVTVNIQSQKSKQIFCVPQVQDGNVHVGKRV